MSDLDATCKVTVRPTIDDAGADRLSRIVLDRLWPGNAGGVHMLFGRDCRRSVETLVQGARILNVPVTVRFRRNGLNVTVTPEP